MTRWVLIPLRVAMALVLAGVVVIVVTWYGAGEQVSSATQFPYVLVGGSVGLGLVALGGMIWAAQRRRLDLARIDASVARLLRAADGLAARRALRRAR